MLGNKTVSQSVSSMMHFEKSFEVVFITFSKGFLNQNLLGE